MKVPRSLLLFFLVPQLHFSWVQSLYNHTGRQCFLLAHFRLTRLADDGASTPTERVFSPCVFMPSLSLSVSSLLLSFALLQIFYAWINSKPCRLYHTLAPSLSLGHGENERISTRMHPLWGDIVSFSSISEQHIDDMVYRFRQGSGPSDTFLLFKQMFLWWAHLTLQDS